MSYDTYDKKWYDVFRHVMEKLLDKNMHFELATREAIVQADYATSKSTSKSQSLAPKKSEQPFSRWMTTKETDKEIYKAFFEAKKRRWNWTKGKSLNVSSRTYNKHRFYYTGDKKYPQYTRPDGSFDRVRLFERDLIKAKTAVAAVGRKWICNFESKNGSCGRAENTYSGIKKVFGITHAKGNRYVSQRCFECQQSSRSIYGKNRKRRPRKKEYKTGEEFVRRPSLVKDSKLFPKDKQYPYAQKCRGNHNSKCNVIAKGYNEVKEKFGFSNRLSYEKLNKAFRITYPNGVSTNSDCRRCRRLVH